MRYPNHRAVGAHQSQPAMPTTPDVAAQVRRPLDSLNFFLADVRDGLGPYLAIYLLTVQRWDEESIGLVMSIATLAGLFAQTLYVHGYSEGRMLPRMAAQRPVILRSEATKDPGLD